MSGNNYGYYYNHQNVQNFQRNQYQDRSQWSVEQDQYNRNHSPAASYKPTTSIKNEQPHTPKNQNYFNNNNYFFHHPPPPIRNRYPNQFINPVSTINTWSQPPPPQALQRNFPNRRKRTDSDNYDNKIKTARKKKKPLSQAVPSKKIWTIEEAEKALTVEKEYNKLIKNHSLIIKFPDLELDRDIVSNFHPNIESVHFQQPSTPRFCFITLKENTDADAVIGELSKIKFGDGHLKVEYKKKSDEEHQNITASDIDPTTLYVGNLAQEITKEDMVKAFPECRRIDIGYAKKMKFTRYAFVSFKTIEDSIAAFKRTHSTQMYSKSLIVRFRRLHGTVGMPGETKTPHIQQQQQQQQQLLQQKQQQQQQQQQQPQQRQQQELQPQLEPNVDNTENTENAENTMTDMENQNDKLSNHKDDIDLNIVKQEICSDEEDDDYIRSRIQTHMMCFGSENIYDVDCSPSDTIPRAINHNLSSGFQFDTIIPKLFATVKQEKLDDYNNENEVSSSVDKQLVQPVSESPTSSTKDDKQDSNKQSTSNDKKQPDIEIEKTLNSIKQEKEDDDDDDDDDDYDDDDEGYGFPVIDFREQLRNLEYNSTM